MYFYREVKVYHISFLILQSTNRHPPPSRPNKVYRTANLKATEYIFAYMYVCIYIHIYTYISLTCIHTHTHTHTRIYISSSSSSSSSSSYRSIFWLVGWNYGKPFFSSLYNCQLLCFWRLVWNNIFEVSLWPFSLYIYIWESNGKLPPRTCQGCIVPEPYRSHDWVLVPANPASKAEY